MLTKEEQAKCFTLAIDLCEMVTKQLKVRTPDVMGSDDARYFQGAHADEVLKIAAAYISQFRELTQGVATREAIIAVTVLVGFFDIQRVIYDDFLKKGVDNSR